MSSSSAPSRAILEIRLALPVSTMRSTAQALAVLATLEMFTLLRMGAQATMISRGRSSAELSLWR